jgi:MFS family permease
VVTALPTFSAKLGASTSQLQWITAAYTLAGAAVMLPVGQLGDKLGRRRVPSSTPPIAMAHPRP